MLENKSNFLSTNIVVLLTPMNFFPYNLFSPQAFNIFITLIFCLSDNLGKSSLFRYVAISLKQFCTSTTLLLNCCLEVINSNGTVFCDDYNLGAQAPEVKIAIDEFVKKNFLVLPKFIVEPLYKLFFKLSNKFNFFENFLTHKRVSKKSGWQNFNDNDNNFKLSEKIINRGSKFLKEHQIDPEKIVCINIWNAEHLKNLDWSHHSHRNGKFSNYLLTINYLISKGYTVIKIGRSNNIVNINNKKFIDYSYNLFEDSLDLFLISKCIFYISNSTGLDHLAFSLNKPMLINTPTIHDFFVERKNIVYLLRPYFSRKLNRELNVDEIIEKKLSFKLKSYDFEEQEVKINDNSPDEILLACKDLLYLIDKEFVLTSEKLDMLSLIHI